MFYVPFAIFVYLFTVSPISTTVLNTFDTLIKLLCYYYYYYCYYYQELSNSEDTARC